jgi:SecD/SecF fusion protein
MTSVARRQLIGVVFLVAAFAGLGGVLTYFRQCETRQRAIRVVLDEARAEVATKQRELKELDRLTVHPEERATKHAQLEKAVKELDLRRQEQEKQLVAAAPAYTWMGWAAGFLAVLSVIVAANMSTLHGRHVIYTVVAAAVAAGLWYFKDPIYGIDLRGGAELRYRMDTSEDEKHLRQLREVLGRLEAGGSEAAAARTAINASLAELEQQVKDARSDDTRAVLRERIEELRQQLDVGQLAQLIEAREARRRQSMVMSVDVIRKRMDSAGIRQVTVRQVGDGEMMAQVPIRQVSVDPAKGEDYRREQQMAQLRREVDELKELISKPGRLGLHHVFAVRGGYSVDAQIAKDIWEGKEVPGFFKATYASEDRRGHEQQEEMILRVVPAVTGAELERAQVVMGDQGREILVDLSAAGGQAIANATAHGVIEWERDRLAIVLDGEIRSAPKVITQLGSRFRIEGRFTTAEADGICQVLNSGSLAYKPELIGENQVGPGLGQDSIDAGVKATMVGAALVVIFMGLYYMGAGLLADMALLLNLLLLIGAMNLLGGTFTLPGIAGIALTAGMAVDANVLIFERIREEKLRGKPLKLAVKAGHERALVTILDSNVTTLITAFILYKFGTGPVKGFAVTLILGILASLFCSLLVTRWMLELVVERGWAKELRMWRILGETKFGFMRASAAMFAFSALLVAGGLTLLFTTHDKYGLDFTGGLEVQMRFAEKHNPSEVRAICEKARQAIEADANRAVAAQGGGQVRVPSFNVQSYNPDAQGLSTEFKVILGEDAMGLLRAGDAPPPPASAESVPPLAAGAGAGVAAAGTAGGAVSTGMQDDITAYLRAAAGAGLDQADPFPSISRVGKQVAGEMLQKAFMAVALSILVVFIYILVRFDFMIGFGIGAAVSLAHDAIIALGVLMLANRLGMTWARIDSEIVAAILAIIGYSLNDTIVVYDRIRENLAAHRSMSLREVVDMSANQTLSRTLLTSATTFVVALSILLLGGTTLRSFALVFAAGVVVGTFSSVFVAAPITVLWERWMERRRLAVAARGKRQASPMTGAAN